MKYPDDIDRELVRLLDALNDLDGIRTEFSCSGHGKSQFWVSLTCEVGRPGVFGLRALAQHTNSNSNDALSGAAPWRLNVESVSTPARPEMETRHTRLGHLPKDRLHLRLTGPSGSHDMLAALLEAEAR